jgi:hypothetical protein
MPITVDHLGRPLGCTAQQFLGLPDIFLQAANKPPWAKPSDFPTTTTTTTTTTTNEFAYEAHTFAAAHLLPPRWQRHLARTFR